MMSETMERLIRTYVPIGVGWLLSWIALPADQAADLKGLLTAAVIAGYYALAAFLENEVHPAFGWLLGKPKTVAEPSVPGDDGEEVPTFILEA